MAQVTYPIALDVEDKRCLVVGGGTIAADKVEGLLRARARVVLVSPRVSNSIALHAAQSKIEYHERPFRSQDLDGSFLVIAATDNIDLNAKIAWQARAAGILVNAVDDPPNCDFYAMAISRRGDLQIAISTHGQSPAFARWVREMLDESLPQELGKLLVLLREIRVELRARGPLPPYERWKRAITPGVLSYLEAGDSEAARALIVSEMEVTTPGRAGVPARWGAQGR